MTEVWVSPHKIEVTADGSRFAVAAHNLIAVALDTRGVTIHDFENREGRPGTQDTLRLTYEFAGTASTYEVVLLDQREHAVGAYEAIIERLGK